MEKYDHHKDILNSAAEQARRDCADKIAQLSETKLDALIEELKCSGVSRAEIEPLLAQIQVSTDRNRLLREVALKAGAVSQALIRIIGKYL